MKKIITSFKWAMHGLRTVWREEANFRIEIVIGIAVLVFAAMFDFSPIEWIVLAACVTMVVTAEIANTVVEDLCNKIEPHHDPVIGKIKDMAAAFVLFAVLGASVMGLLLFYSHFYYQY